MYGTEDKPGAPRGRKHSSHGEVILQDYQRNRVAAVIVGYHHSLMGGNELMEPHLSPRGLSTLYLEMCPPLGSLRYVVSI